MTFGAALKIVGSIALGSLACWQLEAAGQAIHPTIKLALQVGTGALVVFFAGRVAGLL